MHFKEENVKKTATTEIDSVGEVSDLVFIWSFISSEKASSSTK